MGFQPGLSSIEQTLAHSQPAYSQHCTSFHQAWMALIQYSSSIMGTASNFCNNFSAHFNEIGQLTSTQLSLEESNELMTLWISSEGYPHMQKIVCCWKSAALHVEVLSSALSSSLSDTTSLAATAALRW